MTDYSYWKAALAGQKPEAFVDSPMPGFYRTKRGTGWVPVAVWPKGNGLTGPDALGFKINRETVGANMGTELWSHYCAHPITEAEYRKVAESGGDWSDSDPTVTAMTNGGNATKPPSDATNAPSDATLADPAGEFRREAATAISGIGVYSKIESDEADARALSLRNFLNQLAADVEKVHKAEKEPHLTAARKVDADYLPIAKELREAAGKVKNARDDWEQHKRDAAAAAVKRAAEEADRHRQAAEAAERENRPAPPPPPPPSSNLPPPTPKVKPTYGRASSAGTKMVVEEIDYDKFFAALKLRPEWPTVKAQFDEWAQKLANKGIIPDGVKAIEKANTR